MIKAAETVAQICSKYSLHPTQARHWKDQAVAGLSVIFSDGLKDEVSRKNELIRELYQQIGQLKVEADFLKKKIGLLE
jgi:transposase-like protein